MTSSNYQRLPIAEASTKQLRRFAETHLGMSIPGNAKPETVMAKVTEAWTKDFIHVLAETEAPTPQEGDAPNPVTAEQQPPEKKMVRVHISTTDDKGGSDPVPVSVNGRAMLIPRGKDVDIPLRYFQALENAVSHRYDCDDKGNIIPTPRLVKAYPYQRVA